MAKEQFKRCSFCGAEWPSKEAFLADQEVQLEGYQWDSAHVKEGMPPRGILVFTHARSQCGTSITVASQSFKRDAAKLKFDSETDG